MAETKKGPAQPVVDNRLLDGLRGSGGEFEQSVGSALEDARTTIRLHNLGIKQDPNALSASRDFLKEHGESEPSKVIHLK